MDVHHAELQSAHANADADIEAAQTGWIGTSAVALQAKFAEWQAATEALSSDVKAHGAAFRAAAQSYATTDSDNAGSINAQI